MQEQACKKKKTVIFVVASMTGGGTERVISILANLWSKKGYKVSILMTAQNEVDYELEKDIELVCVGGRSGGSIFKRLERIKKMRAFFKAAPDAVICAMGVETNLFTVLATIGLKNRVLISERNDPNQCGYKVLRDFLYGMADCLVCQTKDAMHCFPERVQKKSVVIPNPMNPQIPQPYIGERRKVVSAVGRLTPQKNYDLLLESFQIVHEAFPEHELHIYGKGELEESLKEKTKTLGLSDKVKFMGFVNNAIAEIMEDAVYVLSSDYEGVSNSLAEAMTVGLPVVSTDCPIGGSAMCIENGVNGLLVPIQDKEALAEGIVSLLKDEKKAASIGQAATALRERFSQQKVSDLWLQAMKLL